MKLRNYIILLLAACVWASCSKDEELPKGPDPTPDAFLSLAVNADAKTKAQEVETTDAPRNLIHRLSVFVYVGDFCYYKDSTNADETIKSVESIPVKGGNAVICAVANASNAQIEFLKKQNITEIDQAMSNFPDSDLTKEVHGALTMSSQRFKVTLNVSKTNCIGYTEDEIGKKANAVNVSYTPISLYRTVARVQLSELKLQKNTEFGTAIKFNLKKVFVANVKSKSELLSKDGSGWGATEVEGTLADADYWYGLFPETESKPLKSIKDGTQKDHLCYEFASGKYTDWTAFPYHEEEMISMNGAVEVAAGGSFKNDNINHPVGNFFYVYENSGAIEGAQTLLIVCGDYTYIPEGGTKEITVKDSYYALVVNGPENQIDQNFDGVEKHTYVKRNTKYNISMNIAGPGSEDPYKPSTRAYVGTKIDVVAWDVVKMVGSVD